MCNSIKIHRIYSKIGKAFLIEFISFSMIIGENEYQVDWFRQQTEWMPSAVSAADTNPGYPGWLYDANLFLQISTRNAKACSNVKQESSTLWPKYR